MISDGINEVPMNMTSEMHGVNDKLNEPGISYMFLTVIVCGCLHLSTLDYWILSHG